MWRRVNNRSETKSRGRLGVSVKRVRLAGGTRRQRSGAESCETLDMSGGVFRWALHFRCAATSDNRRRGAMRDQVSGLELPLYSIMDCTCGNHQVRGWHQAVSVINSWSILWWNLSSIERNSTDRCHHPTLTRAVTLCCRICRKRLRYITMPLCRTRCSVLPLSYCVFHSAPLTCVRHSGNANLTDTPSSQKLLSPGNVQVSNCRS
jgi:hypothetical protein